MNCAALAGLSRAMKLPISKRSSFGALGKAQLHHLSIG
jgi:hypothetical protein